VLLVHLALALASAPEEAPVLPDPGLGKALALSTAVGFGAGQFYARQPRRAIPPLVLQAAGLGVAAWGAAEARTDEHAGGQLVSLGLSVLVVGRGLDVLMTPSSVRRTVDGDLFVPRVQLFWSP